MFLPVRVELGTGSHEVGVCVCSLNTRLRTRRPRGRWRSSLVTSAGLRWARTTLLGRAPVYGNLPAPIGFWRPIVATPAGLRADVSVIADPVTGAVEIEGSTASVDEVHVGISVRAPSGESVAAGSCPTSAGRFSFTAHVGDP
jgi:beta-mannosidase